MSVVVGGMPGTTTTVSKHFYFKRDLSFRIFPICILRCRVDAGELYNTTFH